MAEPYAAAKTTCRTLLRLVHSGETDAELGDDPGGDMQMNAPSSLGSNTPDK
jgi:hypothetical protein